MITPTLCVLLLRGIKNFPQIGILLKQVYYQYSCYYNNNVKQKFDFKALDPEKGAY